MDVLNGCGYETRDPKIWVAKREMLMIPIHKRIVYPFYIKLESLDCKYDASLLPKELLALHVHNVVNAVLGIVYRLSSDRNLYVLHPVPEHVLLPTKVVCCVYNDCITEEELSILLSQLTMLLLSCEHDAFAGVCFSAIMY